MGKTKKNKSVREELERIYGKHCMIHEGIRKLNPPKPKKMNYKGKSIASQITLHHLKPRRENGPTTLENGSLACRTCHDWLEQLSNVEREKVNDELREYKRQIDHGFKIAVAQINTGEIVKSQIIEPEADEVIEIPVYDNTPEQQAMYEKMLIEKRKKTWAKFGKEYQTEEELQKELLKDLEMEFNERNYGGYGR